MRPGKKLNSPAPIEEPTRVVSGKSFIFSFLLQKLSVLENFWLEIRFFKADIVSDVVVSMMIRLYMATKATS